MGVERPYTKIALRLDDPNLFIEKINEKLKENIEN